VLPPHEVNVNAKGVALRGCDPVSYQSGPNPGSQSRYAPASGGFCAMGVAMERKLDGDPTLFRVVNNRLCLNVHSAV